MKRFFLLFSVITFILAIGIVSYAHPGNTDANGGHTDYSTGEYHYHHGYPAHQHTGGKCPYDFVNNEKNNSSSNNETWGNSYGQTTSNDKEDEDNAVLYAIISALCTIVFVLIFFASGTSFFENNHIIGTILSIMELAAALAVFISFVIQPLITIGIVVTIVGIAFLINKFFREDKQNKED